MLCAVPLCVRAHCHQRLSNCVTVVHRRGDDTGEEGTEGGGVERQK